ncbi:poly(A) binding protein Nab3 [Schizosaccharomyces cryophilus OY26]|uniref:Poly(A) binding protein Nab3 n=1 Tax=Schizosaccharomyces cryophilus (strain OY26 / ATCC MYA-4695 / CBS 11777 / NBRC 106824 / NRRL Y48691) TaxID=653667 RepID=S9W8H3_SCHCR|nr:poly(A) binding protein Nab3 [Schizosaccharomyces cryophilus OY26]EPY54175.1 poly(A) binding protein Nab3 [Schizosaccharomyces cryophilus OY26]
MDPSKDSNHPEDNQPSKEQPYLPDQPSLQREIEDNEVNDMITISSTEKDVAGSVQNKENHPETDENNIEPQLPWNNNYYERADDEDEDDVYSPPEPVSELSNHEEKNMDDPKSFTDENPADLNIKQISPTPSSASFHKANPDPVDKDTKASVPNQAFPSVPTSGVDLYTTETPSSKIYEPTPMNADATNTSQDSSGHPPAPNLDSILRGIDVNEVLAAVSNSEISGSNLQTSTSYTPNVQDRPSENPSSSSISISHSPNFSEGTNIRKSLTHSSEYDPEEFQKSQEEFASKFVGHAFSDTQPSEPVLRFQPEDEEAYQAFLQEEGKIMSNWYPGQFPSSSRLFLGHLQKENNLSKREVWKTFHTYGRLAQVVLKPTYGFVQFFTDEECARALEDMQGKYIQNQKLYLEISKLQKKYQTQIDSSKKGPNKGISNPVYGSTNPPSWKKRSRSPSFHASKRPEKKPASQGLPKIQADCQIIVIDDTPIEFVYKVENALRESSLNVVLASLTPKLSLQALVHQCVLDGVSAIVYVTSRLSQVGCMSVQTFQRTENPSEIRYDEYANIDLYAAVELVQRSKGAWLAMNPSGFPTITPMNPYQIPLNNQISQIVSRSNPHLSSILGSLDSNTLHQLLDVIKTESSPLSAPNSNLQTSYPVFEASNSNPTFGMNEQELSNPSMVGAPSNLYPEQNQKQFEHILEQLTALQNP